MNGIRLTLAGIMVALSMLEIAAVLTWGIGAVIGWVLGASLIVASIAVTTPGHES